MKFWVIVSFLRIQFTITWNSLFNLEQLYSCSGSRGWRFSLFFYVFFFRTVKVGKMKKPTNGKGCGQRPKSHVNLIRFLYGIATVFLNFYQHVATLFDFLVSNLDTLDISVRLDFIKCINLLDSFQLSKTGLSHKITVLHTALLD